jgi:AcrR family transcriptional regulator
VSGIQRLPATEPARRRRLEPDERREQILDCAVTLFRDRPYAAVSTTDIARQAGIARGLLNHYFGTKRDLYLAVVRRMVLLPDGDLLPATGSLRIRVETSVDRFLDAVAGHGKTFVAVIGAEGVGADPEVEQILAAADDLAAGKVLAALGLAGAAGQEHHRALIRAYGGMVKATVREWAGRGALTREQAHLLLSRSLIAIVREVF